jgi:hypothetical protein
LKSKTFTIAFTSIFLVLVAGGCLGLILVGYSTYTQYSDPYTYVPTRPASSLVANPNATASHTVIIVMDGVRADIFYKTPKSFIDFQNWANWTNVQVNTLTSVSKVGYSTIASGVNSSESQVISNDYPDTILFKGDSLFNDTIRHHGNTSVVGYYWWWEFFKPWLNWSVTFDATDIGLPTTSMNSTNGGALVNTTFPVFYDSLVAQAAVAIVEKNKPTFMVAHFSLADEIAHHEGGSIGPLYASAIKNEDIYIQQIYNAYNTAGILGSTLFIVTADHGQVDIGGHGGTEPEVLHVPLIMKGPGVIIGSYGTSAHQNSIAPTVAALMGFEIPSDASGTILFPCLTLNQKQQAIYRINLAQIRLAQATITAQKTGYSTQFSTYLAGASTYLSAAQASFAANKFASANGNATLSESTSTSTLRTELNSKTSEEIVGHAIPIIGVLVVIALLLAFLFYRYRKKISGAMAEERDFLGVTALSVAMYFVFLGLAILGTNWHFSASYFPDSAAAFIVSAFMPSLIALIPAGIMFLWLMWAFGVDTRGTEARGVTYAALFLILVASIYDLAVVFFVAKNGAGLPWYAPNVNEPIQYFFLGISAAAFAIFGLISFLGGLALVKVLHLGVKRSK